MKILTALLLAGALSTTYAAKPAVPPEPPSLQDFAGQQSLSVVGQEAAYRVTLPASIYAGSRRSDLGDLRFFNGNGELLPYAFLPRSAPEQQAPRYQRLPHFPVHASTDTGKGMHIDLRADKDGRLSALHVSSGAGTTTKQTIRAYVFDASALKQPIAALRLNWQAKDSIAVVNIEASDNLQDWHMLRSQSQLVDLRVGEERLIRNRIELDSVRSKYLRLSWSGNDSLQISSAEAEIATSPSPAPPLQWNAAAQIRAGDAAGEYLFDNPGLPATNLRITLPHANTVVPLRIFHRNNSKDVWRDAGSASVYRLTHQSQDIVSPDLPLHSSRDRYWRIVVDTRGGGIGQGLPGISLGWSPQDMLFVARGDGPYTLAYGNASIATAEYNVATLLPGYKDKQLAALPEAQLEAPSSPTVTSTPPAEDDPVKRNKLILWAVLLLGMGMLAAMVWRLLHQMK